jgi:hypothetical protein
LELLDLSTPHFKIALLIIATFRPEFRLLGKTDARIDLNRLSPRKSLP